MAPLPRITTCPLGLKSHGTNLCPLHRRMDDAMASVEHAFRNSTIAELLAEPTTSTPLCEGPVARNDVVFEDDRKRPAALPVVPLSMSGRRSVEKK